MRRYGVWAGSSGMPERPEDCIAKIDYAFAAHQCGHKRGKGPDGLYCGTHAAQIAKGRHVRIPEDK